jgi:hypothetical protein
MNIRQIAILHSFGAVTLVCVKKLVSSFSNAYKGYKGFIEYPSLLLGMFQVVGLPHWLVNKVHNRLIVVHKRQI